MSAPPNDTQNPDRSPRTRRNFLQKVAGTAAGVAAANATGTWGSQSGGSASDAPASLPTIALGRHRLSRLILGGNPIYGHSHFNRLYSQHLMDYHTPERVVELLRASVKSGINTWQNSYAPRTLEDVERCRKAGIEFNWLLLGKGYWDREPEHIEKAAKLGPIGIAPHGSHADRLHRAGRLGALRDVLKRIRATGVHVGLSAHNPALVEISEEEGWDVDYYMCCLYYLTRPREDYARILGEAPISEIYLPSDRQRMLDVVKAARKPCLVYKIFAAGRLDLSSNGVRRTFEKTLAAIKPGDAMIVGMFQEFGDQVGMNARIVRELSRRQTDHGATR